MELVATISGAVLGVMYLAHGVIILVGSQMQRQSAEMIGMRWTTYRFVSIPELAAGISLLLGSWLRPLAFAAAVGLVILMASALTLRIRAHNPREALIVDATFMVVAAGVAVLHWAVL